jgi:hypothetical protein
MDRIRNSWELGKISWSVLRSDRSLAWFPILSAIGSLVVIGVFAALVAATGIDSDGSNEALKPMGYVFVVLGYIALALVTTYFLAALVHAANERLEGRPATLGTSIAAANAKLHRLLPWALVQATVSMIIQAIEERFGIVGRIIAGLFGAAWAVITFLTVPIIMLEDLGPIAALKRSGSLVRRTWGENILGQGGFGLLAIVAMLPAVLLVAIGVSAGTGAAIACGVIAAIWAAIVLVVLSAMTGIYRVALYRYACDGQAPAAFAGADLQHAFRQRSEQSERFGG